MWPDLSFLNTPQFQAYLAMITGGNIPGLQQGPPTYTPSGQIYNGPFGNDNRTPFRTVAPVQEGGFQPAYNRGLNASSAQLYDHFRRKGPAANYGFAHAGPTQTFENFANRPVLEIPEVPEVPVDPTIPGPDPNTNTSGAFQGGGMVPSIFRIRR